MMELSDFALVYRGWESTPEEEYEYDNSCCPLISYDLLKRSFKTGTYTIDTGVYCEGIRLKRCSMCREHLPADSGFFHFSGRYDGLFAYCRFCVQEKRRMNGQSKNKGKNDTMRDMQ